MVRSVRDAARYLDVTSGPTLTDPTSLPKPTVPYEDELLSGAAVERLRGKRAAFSGSVGFAGAEPEVTAHAEELAHVLADVAGLELVEGVRVDLPRPGASWGVLSTVDDMSWHVDAVERPAGRAHAGAPAPAHVVHEPHTRGAGQGDPASTRAPHRRRGHLRAGRPPAHAHHADPRVRGRGRAERASSTGRT